MAIAVTPKNRQSLHPLRWLNRGRHFIGKYGEEAVYPLYYGAHWVIHGTRYVVLATPFGPALVSAEALGLGGDVAFDLLEGAPACDEHRRAPVPIYHGHYLPGCGRGHLDMP